MTTLRPTPALRPSLLVHHCVDDLAVNQRYDAGWLKRAEHVADESVEIRTLLRHVNSVRWDCFSLSDCLKQSVYIHVKVACA